jgi:hypothetical protein
VAYVYAPDRTAERPIAHLAGFRGVLQVDGYEGYKALRPAGRGAARLLLVARPRQFYELASGGAAPIATEALARIAALYRIESEIRGRPAEERRSCASSAADRSSRPWSPGCARSSRS